MTTSLGPKAQCDTITSNTQVRSPSFTQPFRVTGSPTSPISGVSLNTIYIAGINKYIAYFNLVSGVNFPRSITVRNVPSNLSASYSTVGSAVSVASTSFDTPPQKNITLFQINPTDANPFNRYVGILVNTTTTQVFSTGTAYMKLVIQFNQD
jgi:hypothetical protein